MLVPPAQPLGKHSYFQQPNARKRARERDRKSKRERERAREREREIERERARERERERESERARPINAMSQHENSAPASRSSFCFFITLEPRVESYKSLSALDTSPPRNPARRQQMVKSCVETMPAEIISKWLTWSFSRCRQPSSFPDERCWHYQV